jgi:hypothetical protein
MDQNKSNHVDQEINLNKTEHCKMKSGERENKITNTSTYKGGTLLHRCVQKMPT